MHNSQNKKILQIVLLVLVAVLTLGIGYASITAVNLIINGNGTASVSQENFKVYFTNSTITEGMGTSSIDENDKTIAYFDIAGLHKSGDYAEAVYTVLNASNSIGADISLQLTNSNNDYFKVTETVADSELQAGELTTVTVKVEMIKTPLDTEVSTCISASLIANPINNTQATGNDSASKVKPSTFAGDSWATIAENVKNGDIDDYHIGDTKTVTINNTNYTVRIANKSTHDWCEDENYSQTACGFVVEFADIVTIRNWNSSVTTIGGWPGSELYLYVQEILYNDLPVDLQNVITKTRVISGYERSGSENYVTNDKLFLLSSREVFGYESYSDTSEDLTTQEDYYSLNIDSVKKIKKYEGSSYGWWLRSLDNASASGNMFVRLVDISGNQNISGNGIYNFPNKLGVAPAFRIG